MRKMRGPIVDGGQDRGGVGGKDLVEDLRDGKVGDGLGDEQWRGLGERAGEGEG